MQRQRTQNAIYSDCPTEDIAMTARAQFVVSSTLAALCSEHDQDVWETRRSCLIQ